MRLKLKLNITMDAHPIFWAGPDTCLLKFSPFFNRIESYPNSTGNVQAKVRAVAAF